MDYPLKTTEQLRQQLRSLRKKRGLTQAGLGALIGVTQARVVEIEANPGTVSQQQIMQVLNALGAELLIRDTREQAAPDQPAGAPPPAADEASSARPQAPGAQTKKGSW